MIQAAFKAIIFDLDGTLIDTIDDLYHTVNSMLREKKLPEHPRNSYLTMVGDGIRRLIERALPLELAKDETYVDRMVLAFNEAYKANWNNYTQPYEGITSLLKQLSDRKLQLGVLSNKPQEFTDLCVDYFFPHIIFDKVVGARDNVPKKPDPYAALDMATLFNVMPAEILYVGDTSIDMHTAINAGMFPVGVEWGFRSREELLTAGAKVIIQYPEELLLMV